MNDGILTLSFGHIAVGGNELTQEVAGISLHVFRQSDETVDVGVWQPKLETKGDTKNRYSPDMGLFIETVNEVLGRKFYSPLHAI